MMTIGMKSAAKNCTLPVHHMPSYIASILPTSGFAYEFARSLDFGHGAGGSETTRPSRGVAVLRRRYDRRNPHDDVPPSRSPERFVDTV